MEVPAIHHYVDARREHLHKSQSAAHVEEPIGGGAKSVGNHGTGQHNGFVFQIGIGEVSGGFDDGIGAVGDQNPLVGIALAIVGDDGAIGIGHLQAVDHHQGFDVDIEGATPGDQHFGEVGILEIQFALDVIVFFIEGAAGDEDLDHGWISDFVISDFGCCLV